MKTDREEHAFRATYDLLVDPAPPAPSWEALMDTATRTRESPATRMPPSRTPVLITAASALLVALVIGGLVLFRPMGGTEDELINEAPVVTATVPEPGPQVSAPETASSVLETTTIPATTREATTTTGPADPYSVLAAEESVAELYAAWNSGDMRSYQSLLIVPDGESWSSTGWARLVDIAMNGAGAILEYECDPGTPTDTGTVTIRCSERIAEDQFYTPAGVTVSNSLEYEVSRAGITLHSPACEDPYCAPWETNSSWSTPIWLMEPLGEAREYLLAFDRWLLDTHPEGHGISGWIWVDPDGPLPNWGDGRPCCLYSAESAAGIETVSALVPDFLPLPGDRWPIEPTP